MYTLVLVIYFATGVYNGGTAVASQTVQGFTNEAACTQEAQRSAAKLVTPRITREGSFGNAVMVNHVTWSCFKVS
jgi:hypothetical protein